MKKTGVYCFIFLLAGYISHAQDNSASFIQVLRNAESASGKKDWRVASMLWQQVVAGNPLNAWYWYNGGEASYEAGEYDIAIRCFGEAIHMGASTKADCYFQLAKCYAKKNDRIQAYAFLQKSYDAGARSYQFAIDESAFASYLNDPAFKRIMGLPEQPLTDRDSGWRYDLFFLQKEIIRKAVKPFRFKPESIDSMVKIIYNGIPHQTDFQITVSMMKLLTLVNDGHTMVYPFSESQKEFQQNLPLEFSFFSDGLFIVAADKRFQKQVGSRVISIEGKKIQDAINLLLPVMFKDNERGSLVLGPFLFRLVPLLHVMGIASKPDQLTLELQDEQGKTGTISFPADSKIPSRLLWDKLPDGWINYYQKINREPPLASKNIYSPFWFEYIEQEKAVYFQYNRIEPKGAGNERSEKFIDRLFDFIDTHDIDKLVIDLRINNGGNTFLVIPLMQRLMGCRKICARGKIFVLIGTRTYSAAQNLTTYIERWTPAIFVGEPTGSSPNFVGEELGFQLPYSKLFVNISDRYHQSSWPEDYRTWIAPMLYLPPVFTDYKKGIDKALDAVLNWH
jgi:tetratricopeptide (TPR) repeat protein